MGFKAKVRYNGREQDFKQLTKAERVTKNKTTAVYLLQDADTVRDYKRIAVL
jgi:hypothetical protein